MTGITAHEDLTQRQSKTAQRVLRVYAMVIGLYHVQPSFSRKPKCHRFSVYWRLLISDEYDAKSFNPQPTARKVSISKCTRSRVWVQRLVRSSVPPEVPCACVYQTRSKSRDRSGPLIHDVIAVTVLLPCKEHSSLTITRRI